MLKSLFLSGLLSLSFPVGNLPITKNSLSEIINSSVKINPVGYKNGSGNVITQNGKDFILTNAHVCLPNSEMLSDNELFIENKNKKFHFKIKSMFEDYSLKIKLSELTFNAYYDLCLIPLAKGHKLKALKYPEKNVGLKTNEDYFFFNFNNPENFLQIKKLFNKKTDFIKYDLIKYSSRSEKKDNLRPRGEYYWLEGIVKGGDSGSLLFNEKLELVGQLFGSNYKEDSPKGSIVSKEILDDFLEGRILEREVASIQKQNPEI